MTQQRQSREFDISDLSSIPWLGKRKELNICQFSDAFTSDTSSYDFECYVSKPHTQGLINN